MKKIIKWWLCRQANDLLDEYKDNIDKVKDTLQTWIARLEKILVCFKSMLSKLDDGKLDSDEIDEAVVDVETVIKEW